MDIKMLDYVVMIAKCESIPKPLRNFINAVRSQPAITEAGTQSWNQAL